MRGIIGAASLGVLAAACGGGGDVASVPEQFRGVWSDICADPYMELTAGTIHVYPDGQTYDLTNARFDGQALVLSYDMPTGPTVETYVLEGETLRLTTADYGGIQATWDKRPMQKCS